MSDSSFPRWQPPAAAPTSLLRNANAGISLSSTENNLIATPLTPYANVVIPPVPLPPPRILPMVPFEEVRRYSMFLRSIYQEHRARAGMVLYLDFGQGLWRAALPLQLASPLSFRATLTGTPTKHLPPSSLWRLAGSVQTLEMGEQATGSEALYMDEVPSFDGIHVLIDPRYLMYCRAIVRMGGETLWELDPRHAFQESPSGFEGHAQDVCCKDSRA